MLLAGDVGGTKTLLALYEDGASPLRRQRFESADYEALTPMIREFLGDDAGRVRAAAIGIAGPVVDDRCQATNLPWVVDARELERDCGIQQVRLLNDFAAVALGIGALPPERLRPLQPAPVHEGALAAVIGAGTGLGQAIIAPSTTGSVQVFSTEGGHTDFAPRNAREIALLASLLQRHERVSVERIVSGPGITLLYRHVVESGLAPSDPALDRAVEHTPELAPQQIAEAEGQPAADLAIDWFIRLYGAEAGNLALKTIPRAGLFVAGGIAPKLRGRISDGRFVESFRAKGRMQPVLESIPIWLVDEPQVGLVGAHRLARDLESTS